MLIISETTEFHIEGKSAVAIGKFDGIHLGHKKLLDIILQQKNDGLKSVVFTFDPSPEEFLPEVRFLSFLPDLRKEMPLRRWGLMC